MAISFRAAGFAEASRGTAAVGADCARLSAAHGHRCGDLGVQPTDNGVGLLDGVLCLIGVDLDGCGNLAKDDLIAGTNEKLDPPVACAACRIIRTMPGFLRHQRLNFSHPPADHQPAGNCGMAV